MRKEKITCDAIDCKALVFKTGHYYCLKYRRNVRGYNCMKCKFAMLYVIEARLRAEKSNG